MTTVPGPRFWITDALCCVGAFVWTFNIVQLAQLVIR